jgi:hypothetical protein
VTVPEIDTVPTTVALTVWVGASHITAPVTAAWVVVATAVEAPTEIDSVCVGASQTTAPVIAVWVVAVGTAVLETDTVPEITTVLGTVAVIVWVGASQMSPPVAAACVVVVGMALPPDTDTVPDMTIVFETDIVPLTAADTV